MRQKNIFNIFPRKLKNGMVIFYYYIYDANGKRKQYSTGKTSEAEAYKECIRLTKQNKLNKRSSLEFETYCKDWFIYDDCKYIQAKLLHGFTYSKSHAENQRSQLLKHSVPFFRGKALDIITAQDIEDFIKHLKNKGLSNTSVNHNLKLINIIFSYAHKRNEIDYNPVGEVIKLKSDTKEKGILSKVEIQKLLLDKSEVEKTWNENRNDWLFNLTAYKTGCRLGELQALCKNDILDGYILVSHSMDRKYGMKSTKTNKSREIPINQELEALLRSHIGANSGEYVFGRENGTRPIRHDEVYKSFWSACQKIGLSKEDLKTRRITFHSYRHGFSTRMVSEGVAEPLVRAMTGHSTQRMLEHYTHIGLQELRQIGNL
jgi:site-specific recombinase XerD